MSGGKLYGLLAEFLTAEEVLAAARAARQEGYRAMDAFTPHTVEGLAAELGMPKSRIPSVVLIAGLVGAGVGFYMQYSTMARDYPFNAGGRPYNSWPVFMPIAFEVLILVASLAAFLSMIFLNGLPSPHHPLFGVERFKRASQDRFFLCIETTDPQFDLDRTQRFLMGLCPHDEIIAVWDEPDMEADGEPPLQTADRYEAPAEVVVPH